MRFLCDAMLGGWRSGCTRPGIRCLRRSRGGIDISDDFLVRMTIEEGRVLLTSDRGSLERKPVRDEEYRHLW